MALSATISISGMNCGSCVGRVERALKAVHGVTDAAVNLAAETATVHFDDPATLVAAIDALKVAGYPAGTSKTQLHVDGMSCASCVGRVEQALKAQPGVLDASVSLATQIAHVSYLERVATPEGLAAAVTRAGYAATSEQSSDRQGSELRKVEEVEALRKSLLLAALLTIPVFLLEMGAHVIPGMHAMIAQTIGHQTSWMIQFVLTTLVLIGPGRSFFIKGVPALLRGAPEMNSLVALGTVAAWSYSVLALFVPSLFPPGTRAVYFEAAAVITTLILLGRYLEARAKGRTGEAIRRLIDLQPQLAHVDRGGVVTEVPLADVRVGDVLHVRPGDRLAVDGKVTSGDSYVDESMITGEPAAVLKQPGAVVVGGTVNGNGTLAYVATAVGSDTMLAQIVRMVEEAQGSKLPIQALVDRITGLFVPFVMAAAALTVLVWLMFGPDPAMSLALVAGVSVLIIACPCAMGLATPTSIMVGTGRAAEMGVLFRRGDALQALQEVDLLAFDKTGTLTEGAPALTSFELAQGWTREEALALIAAVEARSEHPIAQAVVHAAHGLEVPKATEFQAEPGMGVRARVDGRSVLIGADRFMTSQGIDLGSLAPEGAKAAAKGESPLYAAIDGKAAAMLAVSDPIKAGTRAAIAALHEMGLRVVMITGDNRATADVIARELGIDDVVAEVLPAGKRDALAGLQTEGRKIAFVGDGINDAPALAQADVGIAIGTGTDVAIEAADVVLMAGDLRGVVNGLEISRRTMRNIRQNLFWAFVYNAALIPVAAGVLYPLWGTLLSPMLAAGAMALSSVFVISNALRLRSVRPVLDQTSSAPSQTRGAVPEPVL